VIPTRPRAVVFRGCATETSAMGEIVARVRAAGATVSDENLAWISPPAYAHVMPGETYVVDRPHRNGAITPRYDPVEIADLKSVPH
jgi:hypothetical protein